MYRRYYNDGGEGGGGDAGGGDADGGRWCEKHSRVFYETNAAFRASNAV